MREEERERKRYSKTNGGRKRGERDEKDEEKEGGKK